MTYRVCIAKPPRGSTTRKALRLAGDSEHQRDGTVVARFVHRTTRETLERQYVPGIPAPWEEWFLLTEKPIAATPGREICEGRYIMSKRTENTKAKKNGGFKARKLVPSQGKSHDGYSVTAVIRWMGTQNWTAAEAMHVLKELGMEPSINSVRTFLAAGKKGERGKPADPMKMDAEHWTKLRESTPAQVKNGKRGRYLLFGQPVTAVLRRMGAEGMSVADAKLALAHFKVKPSDASVSIFVSAGKSGKRGAPAELEPEQLKELLTFKGKGTNSQDKPKAETKKTAKKTTAKKTTAKKKTAKKAKPKGAASKPIRKSKSKGAASKPVKKLTDVAAEL